MILSHLKTFPTGMLISGTTYPDHSIYPTVDNTNLVEFYPDAEEDIPNDLPNSKGTKVRMTDSVDANHAHTLVTTRSITGILIILNNSPARYRPELVASKIVTELALKIRFMPWSLDVILVGPTLMLGCAHI
jgi:hypothetical protein